MSRGIKVGELHMGEELELLNCDRATARMSNCRCLVDYLRPQVYWCR
jgi:hypothetical protein